MVWGEKGIEEKSKVKEEGKGRGLAGEVLNSRACDMQHVSQPEKDTYILKDQNQ